MGAREYLPAMFDFADVAAIAQEVVQCTLSKPAAAHAAARRELTPFGDDPFSIKVLQQRTNSTKLQVPPEYQSDGLCLIGNNHELLVLGDITQGDRATHPEALLFGSGDLVSDPLADHLPLELGEGEKDVQGQP